MKNRVSEPDEYVSKETYLLLEEKYNQSVESYTVLLHQLKQLCPRDHFGKTAKQLQLMIKRLAEDHPHLSDAKLAALLTEQGIKIARRTVNKYRLMEN